MISTQINELMPEVFVKIIMNTGRSKYGFILDPEAKSEQVVLVSKNNSGSNFPMNIETIDKSSVISIDQYMR